MAEQFYTILTNVGKAKIANALPTGQKINLAKMKIGDSNGTYYNPSENQTELVHKVYECNVTSVEVDKKNPSWITITAAIPSDVGGFSIREVGVFDDSNSLIAIGKYPETYKPVASDGSTKELYIKMTLEVTNAASVELKIDPTVILATKKDIANINTKVEDVTTQLKDNANEIETVKTNYAKKTEVNNLASNKAEKVDLDTTNTKVNKNTQELETQKARMDTFTKLANGSTTGDAELIDGRVGANGVGYENIGEAIRSIGKGEGIVNNSLTANKTDFAVDFSKRQLLNYNSLTLGAYFSSNDVSNPDKTSVSPSYACIKLRLEKGKSYVLFSATKDFTFFIDESNNIVKLDSFPNYRFYNNSSNSGKEHDHPCIITCPTSGYIYMTFRILDTMLKPMIFNSDNEMYVTEYKDFGFKFDNIIKIPSIKIDDIKSLPDDFLSLYNSYNRLYKKKIIEVKKDGTGDYTSFVEAIRSIKDSSITKQYIVFVYDNHDIIEELGGQSYIESLTSSSDRASIYIPEYVDIIGIGRPVLFGEIKSSWNCNYNAVKAISTLEIAKGNNYFKNIKITARNMRYAVHDESSGKCPNSKVIWDNCSFTHYGNDDFKSDTTGQWLSVDAYGCGVSSGTYREFKNCNFVSHAFYAFGVHDNANFERGAYFLFDNCLFLNEGNNPDYTSDVCLSTFGDGSLNIYNICSINNSILREVKIKNETGASINRWNLKSCGNIRDYSFHSGTEVPKIYTI